ncbi:glycosyltransferase [Microbacterium sp. X-17]|uniref:glycosyltransferase family 2 protein n=1 Tax=Microbacterium sp. X-17 TaxID=3144404 RepID=UPI0031F51605
MSRDRGRRRSIGRFAGLIIIVITVLAAFTVVGLVVLGHPRSFYDPQQIDVFGFDVWYDANLPSRWLLIGAILFAVVAGLGIALVETRVATVARRASPRDTRRPLAPRRIMAATRGVYAGEVTITAVIPAHNEADNLPGTLASLQAQTTPPDRVIVIADNCTDDTVALARAAGVEVMETVANTHKKAGGLNQALARLLPELGDNDTVLVMDADTRFASDRFLETARRRMTDDRALMAVGGLFLGEPGHGLLGQFQRNEFVRYSREIARRRGRVFVLTGTASVFRSAALRAVAASRGSVLPGNPGEVYDTIALTEDNEITIAIKSLGGLIISPTDCTVVTELMPTWRLLGKQRLRWQRGALENLGQYGVTPTTLRYWAQQIGIGYSVIALTSYFALGIVMLLAIDQWVWFAFWIAIGVMFMLERVITAWRGGWRARLLAALVFPELVYDLVIDVVFVKGVIDMTFGREAKWSHVPIAEPQQ